MTKEFLRAMNPDYEEEITDDDVDFIEKAINAIEKDIDTRAFAPGKKAQVGDFVYLDNRNIDNGLYVSSYYPTRDRYDIRERVDNRYIGFCRFSGICALGEMKYKADSLNLFYANTVIRNFIYIGYDIADISNYVDIEKHLLFPAKVIGWRLLKNGN